MSVAPRPPDVPICQVCCVWVVLPVFAGGGGYGVYMPVEVDVWSRAGLAHYSPDDTAIVVYPHLIVAEAVHPAFNDCRSVPFAPGETRCLDKLTAGCNDLRVLALV